MADIDGDGAERVAGGLARQGPGAATSAALDVRDAAAVAALVRSTYDSHGRLDVMVNNAGIAIGGEACELLLAHWDRAIDVNLRGVVHGVQAVYPLMVRQRSGHIVNTASLAGLLPAPGATAYAMTKFFQHVQARFYPADRMAQDIVRGINRNAALVVAPASARLAWRIWRYTPLVANRMTARHVAWARATFGVQPAEAGAGGTAVEASGGPRRPHR